MKVEDLSISERIKEVIIKKRITALYPPQEDAIKAGALNGENLILASPTASGKTLVAELCAMKHIIEREGKVLYLTPLRALASEKFEEFKKYTNLVNSKGNKVKIGISTGDYDGSDLWLGKKDIIIVTNEKCDSLLRHNVDWIREVSLVVADEIHILNDSSRGPTLEVILTRLMEVNPSIQLLALSATIRNAEELAKWLNATTIATDWRPVKLSEGVYFNGECDFNDGRVMKIGKGENPNSAINLAIHTIKGGGQSLVFADTRIKSVQLAKRAAPLVKTYLTLPVKRSLNTIATKITGSGKSTKISELLSTLVKNGAAFHHAGLNGEVRKIVEDAFKKGKIKFISATPTLAAGVNLPARRVIISSYERYNVGFGRYPITVLEYKQMAGRAGRPNYDTTGESILISRTNNEKEYLMQSYIFAQPERIWSKLAVESVLRSHVLASIAMGFTCSEESLYDFFGKTFCAMQYGLEVIEPLVSKILLFLHKEKMVNLSNILKATEFGHRVSEMYIDPVSAVIIRNCLKSQTERITDFSFLHMVCHTPDVYPRAYPKRKEIDKLEKLIERHAAEFMVPIPDEWDDVEYGVFLAEVKAASILESWIHETSEDKIIEEFSFEPGDLFRLINSVDWLLYASYNLCKLFSHKDLLSDLSLLRGKVKKGVDLELLPIVSLKGVGRVRGRVLYNNGFKSIDDLKTASIAQLSSLPMIGSQLATSIKGQVGGYNETEEGKKSARGKSWEQKKIADF